MSLTFERFLPILIASAAEQLPGQRLLDPFIDGMVGYFGSDRLISGFDNVPAFYCNLPNAGLTNEPIYVNPDGTLNATLIDAEPLSSVIDIVSIPNALDGGASSITFNNNGTRISDGGLPPYRVGERIMFRKSLGTNLPRWNFTRKDFEAQSCLIGILTTVYAGNGRIVSYGDSTQPGLQDTQLAGGYIPLSIPGPEFPPRVATYIQGYRLFVNRQSHVDVFDVYSNSAKEVGSTVESKLYGANLKELDTETTTNAYLAEFDKAGITTSANGGGVTLADCLYGPIVFWDREIDIVGAADAVYNNWPGFTPSPSFYSPLNMASCIHWWSANDSNLTIVDTNRVQQIDDIRNASKIFQSTATRRPTLISGTGPNGKDYIRFESASNQVIKSSSINPGTGASEDAFTVFLYRWTTTPQQSNAYAWQASSGFGGCFRADTLGTQEQFGGTGIANIGRAIDTDWHVQYAYQRGVGNAEIWVDGGTPFSVPTTQAGGYSRFAIGATSGETFPSDIEFLESSIHDALPPLDELNRLGNAYAEKYGFTWTEITSLPT